MAVWFSLGKNGGDSKAWVYIRRVRHTLKEKIVRGMCMRVGALLLATALVFSGVGFLGGCKKQKEMASKYEMNIEFSPQTATVSGTVKLTFANVYDQEISALKFQLYPNAYRENAVHKAVSKTYEKSAYYDGESYGGISISSVNGAKAFEIDGADENILIAELQESLFPGESVTLDICFLTELANVNHRTGVSESAVNLGYFYPVLCGWKDGGFYQTTYDFIGDPFYHDCAEYQISLTLPKEYTVAGGCEILEEKSLESKKKYTMSAMNAREVAFTASKNYRAAVCEMGGKTLSYYAFDEQTAQTGLEIMKQAFSLYSELFGSYAYSTFSIAQTGFCLGGMEYSGFAMIDDGLTGEALVRAIAHETAHQWWYAAVGSNQIAEAWQDEGLAEYCVVLFFEKFPEYGKSKTELTAQALQNVRLYADVYGQVLGQWDTRMSKPLNEYLSEYEYRAIAYDKSVVMWDMLRKSVGDKKFFAALKKYYQDNLYQMASVGDLVGAFEKSGMDAAGYFDGFLQGKGVL